MKTFYIGLEWEGEGLQMKSYASAKEANFNSEEWVKVEAETEEKAFAQYYEERDKWEATLDNNEK